LISHELIGIYIGVSRSSPHLVELYVPYIMS